ncbi:MAG: hypothetical protein KGL39_60255, partial [Patescibacteria group bacterium]|nr:hypothetical protein [Patescibacteria group bacterium]
DTSPRPSPHSHPMRTRRGSGALPPNMARPVEKNLAMVKRGRVVARIVAEEFTLLQYANGSMELERKSGVVSLIGGSVPMTHGELAKVLRKFWLVEY